MTIFKEDRDLADCIAASCRMDTQYDPSEDIAKYRRNLTREIMEDARSDFAYPQALRDYFAAAALTGMCANSSQDDTENTIIARVSYEIADAMIEQRKATK